MLSILIKVKVCLFMCIQFRDDRDGTGQNMDGFPFPTVRWHSEKR